MKVEYDVKVPRGGTSPYSKLFWDFYESGHKNVQIQYDTADEAKKAYKGFFNFLQYKSIADVHVSKRGNTLYLIRSAS